jgi:VWFA-related protein
MDIRRLGLALVMSAVTLTAGAQAAGSGGSPQERPTTTLYVNSNLVVLDVVATDKDGRVVPGLEKKDFSVYENGVAQTIRTLESPSVRPAIPAAPMLDHNGQPSWGDAPMTVVVLDQLNTPIEEIAYSRDQLFKYLQAQPALLAEPTSLIVLNDRGIQSSTPATRDRDALLKIARHSDVSLPFKLKRADRDELLSESFALLRQIALSTRGDHGRKNVIWIGRGFPGLDPMALSSRDKENFLKAVRSTVDMLLEARVALYKIDPRSNGEDSMESGQDDAGMGAPGIADDPFATTFSFNAFIEETGGKNFLYRNDLAREIQEGVSQGSNYYTLSYVPTEAGELGAYRKVTVRVNRPGVSVRSKEGFYVGKPNEEPTKKELGFDLRQAVVSGMQYNGVGLHVGEKNWDAKLEKLDVKVSVDTGSLSYENAGNGAQQATFFVTMAALDEKGKILNFETVSPKIEIPAAQTAQIPSGHITVPAVLLVPAGTKAVRVVVRDNSGRIGTADLDVAYVAGLSHRPGAGAHNGSRAGRT